MQVDRRARKMSEGPKSLVSSEVSLPRSASALERESATVW